MSGEVLYWNKDYAIGVAEIDVAHKEFFRILCQLVMLNAMPEKRKWVAEEGLRFLRRYACQHFAAEEKYMERIGFAELDRHRRRHQAFRLRILPRVQARLEKEGYSEKALAQFLRAI